MREIVLDTETTGLSPAEGHRLVELGCVELFNHVPTGNTFHKYVNPERDMPEEALRVHGLTEEFLRKHPLFDAIADDFLEFIGDAPLVIHNASFDMGFLNAELGWANKPLLDDARAIDTLSIARGKYPGSPASLDALCRRFNVDNSGREKHGALLDSELLAEVYLELIGGRQPGLTLEVEVARVAKPDAGAVDTRPRRARPRPLGPLVTEEEKAAHAAFLEAQVDDPLWLKRTG